MTLHSCTLDSEKADSIGAAGDAIGGRARPLTV
jgi:hypothetical protein